MRPGCLDLPPITSLCSETIHGNPSTGGALDQMMRQTGAHHVQPSLMADSKANMNPTVASIRIPLSIQYLNDPQLPSAATFMIGFCG